MTVLDRLRAATAAAHAEAEQAFDWRARMATPAGYRDVLMALYGFHAAWEPQVAAELADPGVLDGRRRVHLLEADLRHLGVPGPPLARPPCPPLPHLAGDAAALGSLYVVEGSRLGGRLIARHVQSTLGFRAGAGLSYYDAPPGTLWRTLCARLNAAIGPGAETDLATAAALDTFNCLRLVLDPVAVASHEP